jgi:hypothetical protein
MRSVLHFERIYAVLILILILILIGEMEWGSWGLWVGRCC